MELLRLPPGRRQWSPPARRSLLTRSERKTDQIGTHHRTLDRQPRTRAPLPAAAQGSERFLGDALGFLEKSAGRPDGPLFEDGGQQLGDEQGVAGRCPQLGHERLGGLGRDHVHYQIVHGRLLQPAEWQPSGSGDIEDSEDSP